MTASIGVATQPHRRRPRRARAQRRHRHVHGEERRQGVRAACSRQRCTTLRSNASSSRRRCVVASRPVSSWSTTSRSSHLGTGVVSGFEALVRWEHPRRGPAGAARVHRARRGDGADRRARPLGARGGVSKRPPLAAAPPGSRARDRREPLGGPGSRPSPRRRRRRDPRRVEARRRKPRPRSDREHPRRRQRGRDRLPASRSRHSACASRWTTSAPATRR